MNYNKKSLPYISGGAPQVQASLLPIFYKCALIKLEPILQPRCISKPLNKAVYLPLAM